MSEDREFQERLQKIGALVHELETIADPAARSSAKELVQLLMDLHGAGLERILEIIFKSSDQGAPIIDELGQDPLVSSLLVLYGIHPDDLQTRVDRKLKQISSALYKMGGAEAKLISVNGGEIRVQISLGSHACGSTGKNVQAFVEDAIYEAAPDLTSLVIEGLEKPSAGFVGVEKLLSSAPSGIYSGQSSEGMD